MKKIIKLLLLVFWMIVIFRFSSQPKKESIESTNVVVEIIYNILCKFIKNMDMETFNTYVFTPVRKLAHFSEFGLLGILFYINIKDYFKNKYLIISLVLSSLYAISDEVHQYFVEGRYCAVSDMLIDSCGALTGILFIHLIYVKCIKKD